MRIRVTDAIVVHCFDFRLQKFLDPWLRERFGYDKYDRMAIAGGVYDLDYVIGQVDLAIKLHEINRAILINHEDCGAYGAAGNYERHKTDLEEAKRKIEGLFPGLDVETYYLHLDGNFEQMAGPNLGK